jgi:hypothetical protein
LGIGDWAQSPIPNPQSPIPNPQSPYEKIISYSIHYKVINYFYLLIKKKIIIINDEKGLRC